MIFLMIRTVKFHLKLLYGLNEFKEVSGGTELSEFTLLFSRELI